MKDLTLLFIGLIFALSFAFAMGATPKTTPQSTANQTLYTLSSDQPNPPTSGSTLQIRTPVFVTITVQPTVTPIPTTALTPTTFIAPTPTAQIQPTPTTVQDMCVNDGWVVSSSECCPDEHPVDPNNPGNWSIPAEFDNQPIGKNIFCFDKPVIYLYPSHPTHVDVALSIPGTITKSIPHYPEEGWRDILAYPDGTLRYQGKWYTELFYEDAQQEIHPPTNGFIIAKDEIPFHLLWLADQLGFTQKETSALTNYWTPRLQRTNSPYFFVSFFDQEEKQRIDKVEINPTPDIFIEYMLYFKAVSLPYFVTPPSIPKAPARQGFTAVEWGGIIDQK